MQWLRARGLLNQISLVPFFSDSAMWVPLDWPWFWKYRDLREYEPNTLRSLVQAIDLVANGPADFFDCGAHIGLVSHYVAHESRHVDRIWAFEPNGEREKVLRLNAGQSQKPMTVEQVAVSDFSGAARLVIPDSDDDSAYIEPDTSGDIQVITLDTYSKPERRGVVMKIDVEGAELRVLRGAAQRLADAPYFTVLFEAHREVTRRTGIDPLECVRFLNSIRPCGFSLSGSLSDPLDLSRTFFDQVKSHVKRDVIVWSLPRPA